MWFKRSQELLRFDGYGNKRARQLKELIVGSVSDGVIRKASCPVLIVK
jgi:nucleotide-binding universal stress UspA family protein